MALVLECKLVLGDFVDWENGNPGFGITIPWFWNDVAMVLEYTDRGFGMTSP